MRRRLKSKTSKKCARQYLISSDICSNLIKVLQRCCDDAPAWLSCMMGRERISTQFQVDCLYFYFRCEGGTHEEAMEIVRLAMPSPTRSRLIHMKKRLRNLMEIVEAERSQWREEQKGGAGSSRGAGSSDDPIVM